MGSPPARLLVADDQADVLEALKLLLKGEGFEVETAASPRAVLAAVEARDFDALLVDMNYTRDTTSGDEGLDLLSRVQGLESPPPVVVMTAWASIDGAVEAMRRGARDYVEKPWDNRRLLATLRTQVELGRALRKSQRLEIENRTLRREGLPELIAESPAMQPVLRLMERVGPSDANVLILGEHGTGKEVVARWLHAASARAERPLIAVNLGGIPDGLFESELFGHMRRAFTDTTPANEKRESNTRRMPWICGSAYPGWARCGSWITRSRGPCSGRRGGGCRPVISGWPAEGEGGAPPRPSTR